MSSRPAKRARTSRLHFLNSEFDTERESFPLQYRISLCIARRLNSDPREGLHFLIPLAKYSDFHDITRQFRRIELNGKNRVQLAQRARREGCNSQTYLNSNKFSPELRTETRELWMWDGGRGPTNKLARFLWMQRVHLKSVKGFGNCKMLPAGDLPYVYHIRIKFSSNPKLHTTRVKVWFSFGVLLTHGRNRRNLHTTLTPQQLRLIDSWSKDFPGELRTRGRLPVDPAFFLEQQPPVTPEGEES